MTASLSERQQSPCLTPNDCAVHVSDLLIPNPEIDLYHWSVIACDQHTSEPEYWDQTAEIVGERASTLHMILPEVYLERPSNVPLQQRIQATHLAMHRYLKQSVLRAPGTGCILIERQTPQHQQRLGLVLTVDLEHYDYAPGNQSLIRATEETVESRIPPRMAIREKAPLELSHVQLLIDDHAKSVIEPLYQAALNLAVEPVYQTSLMQNGGSVKGWFFSGQNPHLVKSIDALQQLDSLKQYGLMMAVGDGNHSLATAKAHWDRLKHHVSDHHPARFAMAELVNLYDPGLAFEPIHRLVSGISLNDFMDAMSRFFRSAKASWHPENHSHEKSSNHVLTTLLAKEGTWVFAVETLPDLPVAQIQSFLDDLSVRQSVKIDYIHGDDALQQLAAKGSIGLVLPALKKHDLFPYIAKNSLLPRKTFSLGEANEKRYYMECRLISV